VSQRARNDAGLPGVALRRAALDDRSVDVSPIVDSVGRILDLAGVLAILGGALLATVVFLSRVRGAALFEPVYRSYRQGLGRAILLGLEILVAADIIRTVAISPTFASVGVLALIVLVRTFLSFTLQLEIEGRWPWQRPRAPLDPAGPPRAPTEPAPPTRPPTADPTTHR
jgi:uncharacterized membrane protein